MKAILRALLGALIVAACATAERPVDDDPRFPIAARLIVDEVAHDGVIHAADLERHVDVAGRVVESSLVEMTSPDGAVIADLFVFRHLREGVPHGGIEVLVANGRLSRHVGLVQGRLLVGGAGAVLEDTNVSLHDGAAHVVRVGQPGFAPMPGFPEWYLRNGPPIDAIESTLIALREPPADVPTTGQQGSPRNVVGIWPHGVGLTALSTATTAHAKQRRWALAWIDQQFRRSLHYYDDDGRIFRAADHPDAIISGQGIAKLYGRTETYGRPARGSANPWSSFDHQHLEVHRALTVFALTGSELARRIAECTLEGALCYPGVSSPTEAPFNGNTRALGWTARELSFAIALFGADRPQYLDGARNVVGSFALTMGEKDGWPWLTMPPPRCDHICPEIADYEAYAHERGWVTPPFADRDEARAWLQQKAVDDGQRRWEYVNELDESFRMVVVWQTSVAVGGLAELTDVLSDLQAAASSKLVDETPAPAALRNGTSAALERWNSSAREQLAEVLDHGIRCVVDRGSQGAVYLNGDYAPFVKRIAPPASTYHGTTAWNVDALCRAARTSPAYATICRDLARKGYGQSSQASPDEIGISVYWEAAGLFGVRE